MLAFHFLNVGHGDSIVVHFSEGENSAYGVIDSNSHGDLSSPALAFLKERNVDRLSFVCITHPHKDHYLGLAELLEHYAGKIDHLFTYPIGGVCNNKAQLRQLVVQLLDSAQTDDPKLRRRMYELARILRSAATQFTGGEWEEITGPDASLTPTGFKGVKINALLPGRGIKGNILQQFQAGKSIDVSEGRHDNDRSLVLLFEYQSRRILLGADSTAEGWRQFNKHLEHATDPLEVRADVIKLPHHGSRADCSDTFFKVAVDQPQAAIISANGNSHPSLEIISELQKRGIPIRCTNLHHRWKQADFSSKIDTTGLSAGFGDLIEALAEAPRSVVPCCGNITVLIDAFGKLTVTPEFDVICGCNAATALPFLSPAAANS